MESIDIKIPDKCLFLLTDKARYKVLYGGRGSGKSFSIALALLIKGMKDKIRVLCTRQIQASIKDSVHKLLSDLIHSYNLEKYYSITQDSIKGINGTEFIFKGLKNNVSEIKSTQGIDVAWTEEAESITEESWDILIPTIREKGSEIWVSFNPNMKGDNTYQRFVVNKPDNCISVEMNYMDNPFFPDVLREEMEFCKEINYPKYEHIWLGIPNSEAGNLIKMSMFKRFIVPPITYDGMYIVCDTAFSEKKSADNSAFLLVGVKGKDIYFLDGYCKKVMFVELCNDLKSFYLHAKEVYGRNNNINSIYIENKGSGISLTQQLRTEGLPILEIYPTVHNEALKKDIVADKYTRFLEVEAILQSGYVWIPESAHWLPEFERQCEAFTGGKQEEHDDFCFVAGTLIKTKYGDKPIEEVKAGDDVITPFGLRKVEVAKQTGIKEVVFNKNIGLTGTKDHKILTITNGYDPLYNIKSRKECILWTLKNLIIWKIRSLLYLMEENIVEWGERESIFYLIQQRIYKGKIRKDCTLLFGNMSTIKKFQKGMWFIILMVIHLITILKILNVYHFGNIWNYIKNHVLVMVNQRQGRSIWKKLENLLVNGINPKKAGNGIKNTLKRIWNLKEKKEYVRYVDKSLSIVKLKKGKIGHTMDVGAKDVLIENGQDYTGVYSVGKLPVYNLKVYGGVYFANNVLVSNCDVLMYGLKTSSKYNKTDWASFKRAFMGRM